MPKAKEPKPIKLCQYCALPLETQRGKNCNTCSKLTQDAYEYGMYAAVQTALRDGYRNGLRGSELHTYVLDQEKRAVQAKAIAAKESKRLADERQMINDERRLRNEILRNGGFKWEKWENDEEDADFMNLPDYEWILRDTSTISESNPLGDVVTVREAMEKLAARDSRSAKQWLERHPKPEAQENDE